MDSDLDMYVTKRNGEREVLSYKKIMERTKKLGKQFNLNLNYTNLVMKIMDQLFNNIKTSEIDELMCQTCASLGSTDYDYYKLASALCISNHQKEVSEDFVSNYIKIYDNNSGYLSTKFMYNIKKYANEYTEMMDYSRDYEIDYFGFKTLERAYLMRHNNVITERIQHMWLRVAIQIHGEDLEKIKETYDFLSQKYFIHATPTLFNSGTKRPQLSSCYLLAMEDDSIDGIFNTLHDCANISKWAGGIGLHIHNIRATGSKIIGTNGTSNGLVPMLRVFNNTARYCDQGGGKRMGSFAMYLEPWHADIEQFLELRKNHGDEECRARDLFYALWIPDLFMKMVENDDYWYLMCPNECKGLSDSFGEAFETLYNSYVEKNMYRKKMKARELWFQILDSQMETGTPYMLYKDAANSKTNQSNLGTIKSSNLCVAPDTVILTNKGHVKIKSLRDQEVIVWNGEEWSNVTVRKTGEQQNLIRVETDDGGYLDCTPYHKFYIKPEYHSKMKEVDTLSLKPNDKLIKCDFPIIDGTEKMKYAYTHGFFCGDGTYTNNDNNSEVTCSYTAEPGSFVCKRHKYQEEYINQNACMDNTHLQYGICQAQCRIRTPLCYFYSEKKIKLIEHMEYYSKKENGDRITVRFHVDLPNKFEVPSDYCSLNTKLTWFAGLCDADGTIAVNGSNKQLQIASIHQDFLNKIRLMLQTCGIGAKVKLGCFRDKALLPDGNGSMKEYSVQTIYRLLITSCDLYKLKELGFSPHRLDLSNIEEPQRNAKQFVKIVRVVDNNRQDETYCFTEPKRHMGIFNGMITGQCTEIMEVSNKEETAVCNLASISLSSMVDDDTQTFNFDRLVNVTEVVTENLNKIIDVNFYPTKKTQVSNMNHRPIGIGVQGLADAFAKLNIPFDSDQAQKLNKDIFEAIYYGAMKRSNQMAIMRKDKMKLLQTVFVQDLYECNENNDSSLRVYSIFGENNYVMDFTYDIDDPDHIITKTYHEMKPTMQEIFGIKFYNKVKEFFDTQIECYGFNIKNHKRIPDMYLDFLRDPEFCGAYSSFEGSPLSEGKFQFDLWGVSPNTSKYNWENLRQSIVANGVRNSLCIAPMPTASTSQILANNECFEPFTSNIYTRRTLAGEFVVINKHLMKELKERGLWSVDLKNQIIEQKGSIQNITHLPQDIRDKYKIVWDISMKRLIDMAKERGAFICQSQSMNLWVEDPNYGNLTKMHFYAWRAGLKTGLYYLRRKAKHQAQQFTIEPKKNMSSSNLASQSEETDNHEVCEMCSG